MAKKMNKCLGYVESKIESGEWSPNQVIPSMKNLSEKLGVSQTTIRSAVMTLIRKHLIRPANGKFLVTKVPEEYIQVKRLLDIAKNLELSDKFSKGAKNFGPFVILIENQNVWTKEYPKGNVLECKLDDLQTALEYNKTMVHLLNLKGQDLIRARAKHKKMMQLKRVAQVIRRHRSELGL